MKYRVSLQLRVLIGRPAPVSRHPARALMRYVRATVVAVAVVSVLAALACATDVETPTAPPTGSPSSVVTAPAATPTEPSAALSVPALKYRLLDRFSNFFYCDPDYYPIGRGDEQELAIERFPEIKADVDEYDAISARLDLPTGELSAEQKLQVYREHKRLAALFMEPDVGGYRFDIRVSDDGSTGQTIQGTIDYLGEIHVTKTDDTFVTCPICLARGTLIDTPSGSMRVEDIEPGMAVWTADSSGARVAAAVLRVSRTAAPAGHRMVNVKLDDGREFMASPGHPTGDGRTVGSLADGDGLDGATVIEARHVGYEWRETYDLLPSGASGQYWANGVLLGSTLNDRGD